MVDKAPPRWARKLLTRLHPGDTLEEVEGDLEELYEYWYERSGKTQATLKYVFNVITVLPPFVRRRQKEKDYYKPSIISIDMIRNYFKIAFRNLLRYRLNSGLTIMGLDVCDSRLYYCRYRLAYRGISGC
jgi:putative ABC transport system permease protein